MGFKICVNCHKAFEDGMIFCPECGIKYLVFDTNELKNEACPVSVVGQFLLSDDEQIMVKILLKNQGTEIIKAVNLRLKCFDQMGDELEDTVIKIMDQSVENGEVFGDDVINPVSDSDTRSFKIIIEKVLLEKTGLISASFSEFVQTNEYTYTNYINHLNEIMLYEECLKKSKDVTENWEKYVTREKALIKSGEKIIEMQKKALANAELYKNQYNSLAPALAQSGGLTLGARDALNKLNQLFDEEIAISKQCTEKISMNANEFSMIRKYLSKSYLKSLIVPQECKFLNLCDYGKYNEKLKSQDYCDLSFEEGAVPLSINCRGAIIASVTLPEGLKVINESAFEDCTSLSKVVIPSSVTTIEKYAFKNCLSLKEIFIPENVTRIDPNAFVGHSVKILDQADIKREEFWKEHTDLRKELEERKEAAEKEITKLDQERKNLDEQINSLNREKKDKENMPESIEYRELQKKISNLYSDLGSLSIFRAKEKKELNVQIEELKAKSQDLSNEIEIRFEEKKRKLTEKIGEIRASEEYRSIETKMAEYRDVIQKVDAEFAMDR